VDITPLTRNPSGDFAGDVTGIDLTKPLTADQVAAIEAGMDRFAALIFHDQHFDDDTQLGFSRNFGELEVSSGGEMSKPEDRRLKLEMADISNLDRDDKLRGADDRVRLSALGNRLWHSDASFRAIPAKYSLLSARVVPGAGGNTEFADMRAAYDALDNATKAEIEDLVAEHSNAYSRELIGFPKAAYGAHASGHRAKIAVPVRPYRHDRRLADAGGTGLHPRPDRTRNAAAVRLCACLAAVGSGDLGQPHHDAPRPSLR
jgi:alpha-ketoglutarate-dependent 2,4-dichlorophenoxyacetate dioxygenase